ncbi:unnamed protein product, partial [marine sediment metagenome]
YEEYVAGMIEAQRGHDLLARSMTVTQLKDELLRTGVLMTTDAFDANQAAIIANEEELGRLANMATTIVVPALSELVFGLDNSRVAEDNWFGGGHSLYWAHYEENIQAANDAMAELEASIWAAYVAEQQYFAGGQTVGGQAIVGPGLLEALEVAAEAQDKEKKAAREAARAATAAYNEEIRKIRVEEALAGLPGAFAESIDRMREALSGLEDFELIDATELGEKLENMIWAMSETVQALIPMLQNLAEMYGGEVLVESAELADSII